MPEGTTSSNPDRILAKRLRERWPEAVLSLSDPTALDVAVEVRPASLPSLAASLRDDPEFGLDLLILITGVDRPEAGELWVVYHLESTRQARRLTVKCRLPRADPRIASIAEIWPAADWHERETFDLLGVVFVGHRDLRRILLPEDWDGHPLRRDYQFPREYHGIPCSREYAEARGLSLPQVAPLPFEV